MGSSTSYHCRGCGHGAQEHHAQVGHCTATVNGEWREITGQTMERVTREDGGELPPLAEWVSGTFPCPCSAFQTRPPAKSAIATIGCLVVILLVCGGIWWLLRQV